MIFDKCSVRFFKFMLKFGGCTKVFVRRCNTIQSAKVRVRFAPSPTGHLHLGGFRTVLYNYMFARANKGDFILRIEDTDQTRLVPGAVENLWQILQWSGLTPNEGPFIGGAYGPYLQSQRLDIYSKYAKVLLERNLAYPCFCSERRLELIRKEALKNRQIPKYDNQCRHLSADEVTEKQSNTAFVIRFKLDSQIVTMNDIIFGASETDPGSSEGDPIIMKSDGFPTYHFANVVDDHLMEITHVLRGSEWISSTPKHLLLYKAFGWEPPKFAHLPLIINKDGTKLSKRQGDVNIDDYKNKGYYPEALINFVTYVGGGFGSMKKLQLNNLQDLFNSYSIEKMSTTSARLDFTFLEELNKMSIQQRLESLDTRPNLINDLRHIVETSFQNKNINLVKLSDKYLESVLNQFASRISRLDQLTTESFLYLWSEPDQSIELLKSENILPDLLTSCSRQLESVSSFKREDILETLHTCAKNQSIKFEKLMRIIRISVTGLKVGPPVAEVLEFLGKKKSLERINTILKLLANETK